MSWVDLDGCVVRLRDVSAFVVLADKLHVYMRSGLTLTFAPEHRETLAEALGVWDRIRAEHGVYG